MKINKDCDKNHKKDCCCIQLDYEYKFDYNMAVIMDAVKQVSVCNIEM